MSMVLTSPDNHLIRKVTRSDYMPGPTELSAWQALQDHQREIAEVHMRDLFARDPQRFERFSLRLGDILLD